MRNITDNELRKMRDAVYPAQTPQQVQSDEIWERVKVSWQRDVEWLTDVYNRLPAESHQPQSRPPQSK